MVWGQIYLQGIRLLSPAKPHNPQVLPQEAFPSPQPSPHLLTQTLATRPWGSLSLSLPHFSPLHDEG